MVPSWMKFLGSTAPFLLIISAVTILFGIWKLKAHLRAAREDKDEEERKRKALLAKFQADLVKSKERKQ